MVAEDAGRLPDHVKPAKSLLRMKLSHPFLIFFILITLNCESQYFGGRGDGTGILTSSIFTINDHSIYCSSSNGDGFSWTHFQGYPYENTWVYNGSDGDGTIFLSESFTLNHQIIYISGSVGDGSGHARHHFTLNDQMLYCSGGPGDGNHHSGDLFPLNDPSIYCSGGEGDGTGLLGNLVTLNNPSIYCSGGYADGLSLLATSTYLYGFPIFCLGSDGDGMNFDSRVSLPLNFQYPYCTGSEGDGLAWNHFRGQVNLPSLFAGGTDDGGNHTYPVPVTFGYGIWTGNISDKWYVAGNWKHDSIPALWTNVFIPYGRPHYPVLAQSLSINSDEGTYWCRRLDIDSVAFFDIAANLFVDGIFNISGTVNFLTVSNSILQVNSSGELKLIQGGIIRLETDE
jgi:hypothetical protein